MEESALKKNKMKENGMQEIEIKQDIKLTDEQVIRCEMHSFTNLVNSVFYELQLLTEEIGKADVFASELTLCEQIIASFYKRDQAIESVNKAESFGRRILEVVQREVAKTGRTDLTEYLGNLESMMAVADVRTRELLARLDMPGQWASFQTQTILDGLRQVLDTIALTSHGRFEIVYDKPGSNDRYSFSLRITGDKDGRIDMPPIFIDCLRDLVANSRKYTPPGGSIQASLTQTPEALEIIVEDNGRGIPPAEIQQVVSFGFRGTNVRHMQTRGGGFGLTKAWYASKQYGGRFWIASEIDRGTRIRILLPRPASAVSRMPD